KRRGFRAPALIFPRVLLLVDGKQAFLCVELDRRDGLAVTISIPREDAALIKMRGLQFALLALVLNRCLEPCVENCRRVVILILNTATRNLGPKLPGLTLIFAKRPEHRRNGGDALQLRRLDRYQVAAPPEESMQTSLTE